ncbi:hypothetical protein M231_07844 [Tremella mesenterica]|uniref:WSC domain-containing protein n=1 Tax=Tremella mesenterica TaxID=5217 RepID=A0A4V1M2X7_TREME|nr:hypothetical protein M231_07844 [Tremella mesenterica]
MFKSTLLYTFLNLLLIIGVQSISIHGPRERDGNEDLKKRTTIASGWYPFQIDPWSFFPFFDWDSFIGWGWQGHTLSYVKEWYYDTYGLNLPPGVSSWSALSFYVAILGTENPKPTPTLDTYQPGTTENPWDTKFTSSSTSSSRGSSVSVSPSSTSSQVSSTFRSGSTSSSTSQSATPSASPGSSTSKSISSTSLSTSVSSTSSIIVSSSFSSFSSSASSSKSKSTVSSSTSSSTSSTRPLPTGWKRASTPCISEGLIGRALTSYSYDFTNTTIESCLALCDSVNMPLAGIEYRSQCFCGSYLSNGASLLRSSTCLLTCVGDSSEICGGSSALSLFVSTKPNANNLSPDLTQLTLSPVLPEGWSIADPSIPCIKEPVGRALTEASLASDNMTVPLCLNYCASKGSQYAGLEYSRECYCGSSLSNGVSITLSSLSTGCTSRCSGNSSTYCGGSNSLQIYSNPNYAFSKSIIYSYVKTGCIQEVTGRALRGASLQNDTMSIEMCIAYCIDRGMGIAGLEYGTECYCGTQLLGGSSLSLSSGQCNMPCGGNKKENCGGPNALFLYITPSPPIAGISLPTGWTRKGCFAEPKSGRALTFEATSLIQKGTMSGALCAQKCAEQGYTMAGTEYSVQCGFRFRSSFRPH